MPPDSGMAFVVVIHLAPEHDSHLAEMLQRSTAMPVMRLRQSETIEPNHVYVIPPAHGLRAIEGTLVIDKEVGARGRSVAVDMFFRTPAEAAGTQATAIVLCGFDSDGAIGLKRVKERGRLAIAQDPDEAQHAGMPRAAIATGMVDWVMPVAEMPGRLVEYRQREQDLKLPREEGPRLPPRQASEDDEDDESDLHDVLTFCAPAPVATSRTTSAPSSCAASHAACR